MLDSPAMLDSPIMVLDSPVMMLDSPMMLNSLLMLLASLLPSPRCRPLPLLLQLLPRAASSREPLLPPTLSADPSYRFYYEGERLAFACEAKTTRKIGGFRFFNQSGEQIDLRAPYPLPTAWLQLTATKASAGKYSCMYFVEDLGREIPSERSSPLAVEVQAAPVAPTFSLDPQQQIYRTGDSVKLLCSIPSSQSYVREIQYYGDFGLAVSVPVPDVKNHSYELRLTGRELSGSYGCAYFVYESARPVRSERSRWIRVAVKRHQISWIRDVVVGGLFFTINGLIFFFTHLLMKRQDLSAIERRD